MRKNKRIFQSLLIVAFVGLVHSLYGSDVPMYRIGIVIDGPWGTTQPMLEGIKNEIFELTSDEFNVQFPADKTIQADWSIEGIRTAISQLLSDPEVDMILTLGLISSNEVCHRSQSAKPVIAPFVLDAELQGLPMKNGKSGIKNLNYISIPVTFQRDMQIFQDIVAFKKLAVLLNQHLLDSFPDFVQRAKGLFQELNLEAQVLGVGTSVQKALSQLSKDVEAVYVLPLPHLSDKEYKTLCDRLIDRKLPSFSYSGAERVEQGMLAGLNKDALNRISRRVALNVQRILLGEKPEFIPVAISLDKQLTINMATANAINVYPSWAVVTEAEIVPREKPHLERQLDLIKAVQEAVAANLNLAAKEYYVAAGKQNVYEARSKLLPSMDLSGTYLVIDKDRAENSMGQQAERTLSGTVTATQVSIPSRLGRIFRFRKICKRHGSMIAINLDSISFRMQRQRI